MAAYYNENDPYLCQWLHNLIVAGVIADGDVDSRSITDVSADDLQGYTQCHFFAGVGIWSYALRQAGWPDDKPVWTGSCPCQPFSSAGKHKGINDERHLWPVWFRLIEQRHPSVVLGEQVASSDVVGKVKGDDRDVWLDVVSTDMERAHYAIGPFDLPAAGFGAPQIRQRIYFVAERVDRMANPKHAGHSEPQGIETVTSSHESQQRLSVRNSHSGRLGHTLGTRLEGHAGDEYASDEPGWEQAQSSGSIATTGSVGGVGYASFKPGERHTGAVPSAQEESAATGREDGRYHYRHTDASEAGRLGQSNRNGCEPRCQTTTRPRHRSADDATSGAVGAGATNGFWADADWLGCRDGKFRPVRPGTFPLVDEYPGRVGEIRAYGNAIVAQQAAAFVKAYMKIKT